MKTINTLTLAGIATALFATGSAFAGDANWRAVDNHHGAATYLPRAEQKEITIALYHERSGKGIGRVNNAVKRDAGDFREVTTPHGTVSYYAPAE
jgi:hypothetical protein